MTLGNAMSSLSFRMNTSGRCGEIECFDQGNVVRIYWEMSGSPKYDLLLAPLNLTSWSTGAKSPIPRSRQREILVALRQWLRSKRLRTDIDIPVNRRTSNEKCRWSGCEQRQLVGLAYCPEHYDESLLRGACA